MTSDYLQPGFMMSWFSNLFCPCCQAGELLMLAKRSRDKTEQERILRDSLQVGFDRHSNKHTLRTSHLLSRKLCIRNTSLIGQFI